jgi:hypothetical protein
MWSTSFLVAGGVGALFNHLAHLDMGENILKNEGRRIKDINTKTTIILKNILSRD